MSDKLPHSSLSDNAFERRRDFDGTFLDRPAWWWTYKQYLRTELEELCRYAALNLAGLHRENPERCTLPDLTPYLAPRVVEIVKVRYDQLLGALIELNMMQEGDFIE